MKGIISFRIELVICHPHTLKASCFFAFEHQYFRYHPPTGEDLTPSSIYLHVGNMRAWRPAGTATQQRITDVEGGGRQKWNMNYPCLLLSGSLHDVRILPTAGLKVSSSHKSHWTARVIIIAPWALNTAFCDFELVADRRDFGPRCYSSCMFVVLLPSFSSTVSSLFVRVLSTSRGT